jgi:hypothetical protein
VSQTSTITGDFRIAITFPPLPTAHQHVKPRMHKDVQRSLAFKREDPKGPAPLERLLVSSPSLPATPPPASLLVVVAAVHLLVLRLEKLRAGRLPRPRELQGERSSSEGTLPSSPGSTCDYHFSETKFCQRARHANDQSRPLFKPDRNRKQQVIYTRSI